MQHVRAQLFPVQMPSASKASIAGSTTAHPTAPYVIKHTAVFWSTEFRFAFYLAVLISIYDWGAEAAR